MKRPLVIAMSLVALSSPLAFVSPALVTVAHAAPPDVATLRATSYEFVAWSTDSTLILLKLQDPQAGVIFQVRDAKTGDIFKMGNKPAVFPSQNAPNSDEERKFIKQIVNGQKVKVDGQPVKFDQAGVAEATHPVKTDIMLMLGQKGDKLVVMGIRGDKASKYHAFDLLKDKKGVVAKASQKALIWDNDGKNVCIIYNQKLESADTPFDGDFFEVLPFKSYKVKGGGDDKEGGNE